ncbi:MAG: hypothetical protein HY928_08820 [Elusimicrobia bacterium]|nr:hypothetical protein [Elusimicrobiota bacterium]
MTVKSMTLNTAVMSMPSARLQGILLKPTGLVPGAAYIWRRVFLKAVKGRER